MSDDWKTMEFAPVGEKSIVGNAPQMALKMRKLDYDREPIDEKHPETGGVVMVHSNSGEMVAFYPSNPGVFVDEQGKEVSEDKARRVLGSAEVLRQSAERRMKEAKAKAFADIEQRYKAERAALDAEAEGAEVPSVAPTSPSKDISELASDGERTWKS